MTIKQIDYAKCIACCYPAGRGPHALDMKKDQLHNHRGEKTSSPAEMNIQCAEKGNCTDVCPMDVLRVDEYMHKPVIQYPEDCMTCYNCELACPVGAIQVDPLKKPVPQVIEYPSGDEGHDK